MRKLGIACVYITIALGFTLFVGWMATVVTRLSTPQPTASATSAPSIVTPEDYGGGVFVFKMTAYDDALEQYLRSLAAFTAAHPTLRCSEMADRVFAFRAILCRDTALPAQDITEP